ncbi:MAG: PAS domain-containing protein [Rivihabitans pingtungensis]
MRHDRLLADIPLANSQAHDIEVWCFTYWWIGLYIGVFPRADDARPAWESTWLPRFHRTTCASSTAQPFLIKLIDNCAAATPNLQPLVYLGLTLGMAVGFAGWGGPASCRSRQQGMQLAESLQREREMAAMTLQHIHDGVIRIDSAGRIDYLNPMAAMLLQTPPEQVIGQSGHAVFRLHFEMSQHMQDNPVNESLKFRRPVELPKTPPAAQGRAKPVDRGQYLAAALRQHLHAGALITFRYLGSAQ